MAMKKSLDVYIKEKSVSQKSETVVGHDVLIKEDDGKPIKFALRFHLYPGLTAVKTISGNSVLIRINKNKSLLFFVKDENIIRKKYFSWG